MPVQVGTIATYDAYFAEPKEAPKAAIVLISDIFGWAKKNIRIYADKLAAAGDLWLPNPCIARKLTVKHPNCWLWELLSDFPDALYHVTDGQPSKVLYAYSMQVSEPAFLDAGYVTVVPDFFRGKALTPDFDFSKIGEWLGQYPQDKVWSLAVLGLHSHYVDPLLTLISLWHPRSFLIQAPNFKGEFIDPIATGFADG